MGPIRAVLFDVDDTLLDHESAQRAGIEHQLRPFADAAPLLDRLAEVPGLRLGAFSNVNGDFTRRKLKLTGRSGSASSRAKRHLVVAT